MIDSQTRQDISGIRAALERIANVLEAQTAPPPATDPEECAHPLDARMDFGVTNGVPDWQCKACGYHSITFAS
jgi:hypothetical protein